ncbi:MAG: hypothetical protein EA385_10755 [Salinarimonadaceae bacterium]|nr:MAG: hypothetical protein EA385_10755 [Salinarimonadaceae bacterium]
MREKLAQLATVRTLRARQRRREYVEAQAEMARRESDVAEREQEVGATHAGLTEAKSPLHSAGVGLDAAEIERRNDLVSRYEGALLYAKRDAVRARKHRDSFRDELERRRDAMRMAENAVEQLVVVDERLADEEIRIAELQEELQAEAPPKSRWSKV